MDTRTKKLTSMFLIVLLALTLTAPSLAEAGRKHHHQGHHHHGGYSYIYSQPPGYYRPYPQPQYYYPAPVYAVPPQVIMGVDTGHASFMIRF